MSWPQGLHDPQPGPHGPLRIIFVRQGVAEVDEQAIAEILGDMPLKAGDHLGAGLLIGPHHLAQVFRVELAGQRCRVHQITEEHGELTAFGVGRAGGRGAWGAGLLRLGVAGGDSGGRSPPVQTRTRPSSSTRELLRIDQIILEVVERLVIELELPLQHPIGHAAPLAQKAITCSRTATKSTPLSSLPGARPPCPCDGSIIA